MSLNLNCYQSYAKRHFGVIEKTEVALADRMIVGFRVEHPVPIELIAYESSIIKKINSRCRYNVLIAKPINPPIHGARFEITGDLGG